MVITNCQVDHKQDPLGYFMTEPVFSWTTAMAKGKVQKSANIQVWEIDRATGKEELTADTGWKNLDSRAAKIPMKLKPRTMYRWVVSVRTDHPGEKGSSGNNYFETSKMQETWKAQWIGCDDKNPRLPIFSKDFQLTRTDMAQARLYITGLGLYRAAIDDQEISDELLAPGFHNYYHWVQYQTYDVTEYLQEGNSHNIQVELGNGWYMGKIGFQYKNAPYFMGSWKLLAELIITYADGTEQVIATDNSWKVSRSAITKSSIYYGEYRDNRLVLSDPPMLGKGGTPGGMEMARKTDPPMGNYRHKKEAGVPSELTARYSVPVVAYRELDPVNIIHTPAGELVLDFGQNISGAFSIPVDGPEGTVYHIQVGEVLQHGNFYRENLRSAQETFYAVADGFETQAEPRFTFYGFRYMKIEVKYPGGRAFTAPADFDLSRVYAYAISSDCRQIGFITSGNEYIGKIVSNTRWGMRDNFVDVPTDCPQRDERLGWTGDAEVFSATALYLSDSAAFYHKFLHDMALDQKHMGGECPEYVPFVSEKHKTSAAWGDAATVIPWNVYLFTGDRYLLESYYPQMKMWVDFLQRTDGKDHGWRKHFHYGDWLALDGMEGKQDAVFGATDTGFIADVYYRKSCLLTAKAARVLGYDKDAEKLEKLAETIRQGLEADYFQDGSCTIHTQTAALLTYAEGIADKDKAAELLVKTLEEHNNQLVTGFVGTQYLCKVLCEIGRQDLAYKILLSETYPGWIYEIKHGATTIWERWNSILEDGSISSTGMNSLNHYAYGSIVEWLFGWCGGLRPVEEAPGFRKAVIRPFVDKRLSPFTVNYDSASGEYDVSWQITGEKHLCLDVSVPFGCEATLILPGSDEGPKALSAGRYHFEYDMK